MNAEEIKRKLDEATKRRMEISDNICWLKDQLAEAEKLEELDKLLEKSKLRHGDCGESERGGFVAIDSKEPVHKPPRGVAPFYKDGWSDGVNYTKDNPDNYTTFFNVFDLIEGWSEPFEEWENGSLASTEISIENNKIRLYACTGGHCEKDFCHCELGIERAEKFWHKLGHAIADLKRKETK